MIVTQAELIQATTLDELLLDEEGRVKVLHAEALKKIDKRQLRLWCHLRAVYLVPSKELVDIIKGWVGKDFDAIEIGAGNGCLGRALGIPMYDNFMQRDNPEVVAYYNATGQPTINYGSDVQKADANDIVKELGPVDVVGAWITHAYKPDEHWRGGNMFGVNESELIQYAHRYVMIGDEKVHQKKSLLNHPHKSYSLDGFAFGRGEKPRVWVW